MTFDDWMAAERLAYRDLLRARHAHDATAAAAAQARRWYAIEQAGRDLELRLMVRQGAD